MVMSEAARQAETPIQCARREREEQIARWLLGAFLLVFCAFALYSARMDARATERARTCECVSIGGTGGWWYEGRTRGSPSRLWCRMGDGSSRMGVPSGRSCGCEI